jgi:hypothetical protein
MPGHKKASGLASARSTRAPGCAIRVTYNPKDRAAYICLDGSSKPRGAWHTLPATRSINLDFDGEGHLVGIELLDRALLHPALLVQAEK